MGKEVQRNKKRQAKVENVPLSSLRLSTPASIQADHLPKHEVILGLYPKLQRSGGNVHPTPQREQVLDGGG